LEVWVAESVTLFRPVNSAPPRLPEQPIFYPVCNRKYAQEIASKWNVDANNRGYVTRFEVAKSFLDNYDVQQVGNATHQEYWIPAEELNDFDAHLFGKIEVLESYG
jgi:hypothetical protein